MFMMNSGHVQSVRPSYGSWLLYGLGTENQNLPGYVVLCPEPPVNGAANWSNRFLPGIYQGRTSTCGPTTSPSGSFRTWQRPAVREAQRRQLDLIQQHERRQHRSSAARDPLLEARIASLEMAFRMQTPPRKRSIWAASRDRRKMYGLDRTGAEGQLRQNCLLARRLVERGVRVVQVYYGNGQPWDTHSDNAEEHRNHGRKRRSADRGPAHRSEAARPAGGDAGALGRRVRPHAGSRRGNNGRDHNHWGFSVWLAGGGVKGGHGLRRHRRIRLRGAEKRSPCPRSARHHAAPAWASITKGSPIATRAATIRLTDVEGQVHSRDHRVMKIPFCLDRRRPVI